MSNVPGDLRSAIESEDLSPLIERLFGYYQGPPVGFAQTPDANQARNLLANLPAFVRSATVQVQGGPIRYTVDGTTPSAAVGHRADAGAVLTLTGRETVRGFQWIDEGAAVTTLAVTFWA